MYTSGEIKKTEASVHFSKKNITVLDGIAIVAGMVIGPGIFKTPSLVAANSENEFMTLSLWALGGFISFIGALCYAELTSTYPHAGGEYHYLAKSFGKRMAFLFAWARMTVIQTGSIAMLSFVIGDYASEALRLGPYSSSIYAAVTVFILTAINLKGIHFSSGIQKALMGTLLFGIVFIVLAGLLLSDTAAQASDSSSAKSNTGVNIGQAMIFILLTYGGWNEAAYISADVGRTGRGIVRVLFYSIALITIVYLITNFSLIKGLGFQNMSGSDTVAADLVAKSLSNEWVRAISIIIAVAALSTVNAVMITGARTNFALGHDFKRFSFLSRSHNNAFLFQSTVALVLIAVGTLARSGFTTMVEYTAPVFWFFFLLVGVSLFVLRKKEPDVSRPFLVPLYPVIPILFCLAAAYMLYASLVYTGTGAVIGVVVLLTGIPFIIIPSRRRRQQQQQRQER